MVGRIRVRILLSGSAGGVLVSVGLGVRYISVVNKALIIVWVCRCISVADTGFISLLPLGIGQLYRSSCLGSGIYETWIR